MKRLAVLGAMKVSLCLKDRVGDEIFDQYASIISKDITTEELTEGEDLILSKEELTEDPRGEAIYRLVKLCKYPIVVSLLELMVLKLTQPRSAEIIDIVSPGNERGVTLLCAARVTGFTGSIDEVIGLLKEAKEVADFLFAKSDDLTKPFFDVPYFIDEYVLGYLSLANTMDSAFSEFGGRFDKIEDPGFLFGMEEEATSLASRISAVCENPNEFVTAIVSGEKESGRYSVVKHAAKQLDIDLIYVEYDYLSTTIEPKELIRRIVRSSILENRALVIRGVSKERDTAFFIDRIVYHYRTHSELPLFVLSEPSVKLIPSIASLVISCKIPKTDAVCLALWNGYLPDKYKDHAEALASKMRLSAGQVKRVTDAIKTADATGETVDERMICKFCYDVLDDGRYDNIKRVEPGFTINDLKIDDHNRAVLMDVCSQVELRRKVYDGWNLKKRYAYGRCVSVILAGPPGTGKTMTVHALAGQLGLELYKVDLSQIVDKYIGETEKRLEEVFTKAQKSNMILFFDEADAVMSKRSEVKDSKDKYANTEISFILQRIEEFDGIVLLATNNLQNIDTAFMRRIRYVINFQLPDKETRKEIWKSAFGSVPLRDDIDYDFLADKFELSGGEIKNIVLNAVFYGAADGDIVGMEHIMKAVYRENTKLKRIAFDGDYGGYAYMLHD